MSCGHLSITKATNSGYGWRLMPIPVRLSVSILGQEMRQQPASCGSLYLRCIDNALSLTLTFGQPTQPFCPRSDTLAVGKETGKTSGSWTLQQHSSSACFSASPENVIVLEVIRESHWCNLVLCSCLQQIITFVGLPISQVLISFLFT